LLSYSWQQISDNSRAQAQSFYSTNKHNVTSYDVLPLLLCRSS